MCRKDSTEADCPVGGCCKCGNEQSVMSLTISYSRNNLLLSLTGLNTRTNLVETALRKETSILSGRQHNESQEMGREA